ncbi:glycosyltransferase family 2 protein [Candidatus Collierbacteria bacterium]|nr:glycosyltransferase family 2 protein [Candidatus Collierbacteria bacterium]
MQPFLSIVIPSFNESENISKGVLDEVENYLSDQKYEWEIILVDDGSTDGTFENLQRIVKGKKNWRLVKSLHQGKAQTVKAGVMEAVGNLVLFTDFDQATPLSEVEKLLPFMQKGYDVAIGSREVKGSERLKEPWYRHLMGKVFNRVVQMFAIRGISDTQCGFKLFANHVAKELFNSLVVYSKGSETTAFTGAFDVELLYISQKRGYRIAEVPVSWKYVTTVRVNPIRDSVKMFLDVLRIRITDLFGGYR